MFKTIWKEAVLVYVNGEIEKTTKIQSQNSRLLGLDLNLRSPYYKACDQLHHNFPRDHDWRTGKEIGGEDYALLQSIIPTYILKKLRTQRSRTFIWLQRISGFLDLSSSGVLASRNATFLELEVRFF
jgi:hypothetical protein